jgi:protein-tyrosine-phosphatase
MIKSVLFVCTGNTCRSPMAERIFTALARKEGLDWTASSAGTHAAPGMPMTRLAAAVAAERGLDTEHQARPVDAALLEGADRVVVMEAAQRQRLVSRFPKFASKIELLDAADIADPIGGDAAKYASCAAAIEAALQTIIRREIDTYAQNPR